MNNNNSALAGPLLAMTLISAAFMVVAAIVFAVVAFIAFAITILCILAWNKPLTAFGETLKPHEARTFVGSGIAGAGLLLAFALFCSALFGLEMRDDAWVYALISGYSIGSLGYAISVAKAEEAAKQAQLVQSYPAVIEHDPKPAKSEPRASAEPFRFASWDDEIELKKSEDSDRCRGCAWNDEVDRPVPGVSQR